MKSLSHGVLAVAALVTLANAAQGATAGHMLKSATPAANSDQDTTGSIKKPGATDPDATGSIKKRRAKHPGVTGSIKPKPNAGN
jgi:hypothetical protein